MDFYDKLVISITIVIVTIFCVFNTFCFASSIGPVPYSILNDASFVYTDDIVPLTGFTVYYIPLIVDHSYTINFQVSSGGGARYRAFFFDNVDFGSQKYNGAFIGSGFTFVADGTYDYFAFCSNSEFSKLEFIDNTDDGQTTAVKKLSSYVGIDTLWNVFEISVPYIVVVVLVGFGSYLIFHNIKEISKGREKMN